MWGDAPKTKNCLLESWPLVVQASPARWVFWEPICISGPPGTVVRGCLWLQWIFLKTLSTHLPISWWVVYECTCPRHAECSAVSDPKQHDLHAPPSLFTQLLPEWITSLMILWVCPGWLVSTWPHCHRQPTLIDLWQLPRPCCLPFSPPLDSDAILSC